MVKIARVVYDDGVEAYNTYRALYCNELGEATKESKRQLKLDFDCAGCEILKVDLKGGLQYENGVDFFNNFSKDASMYTWASSAQECLEVEVKYITLKFVEYFTR